MSDHRSTQQLLVDGLLLAPVDEDGVWPAFRALRAGMRREAGVRARAAFVMALDAEGRTASEAPAAVVLLLGYRSAA